MAVQQRNTQVVVVISHIQHIGCQPEKLFCTAANTAYGLLNREKSITTRKRLAAPPLPPPRPTLLIEVQRERKEQTSKHCQKRRVKQREKKNRSPGRLRVTHPHACMLRRYAGVGPYRIPSTRQLGYASVYGNTFSCLACLPLFLTMPTRVVLLFPPCGHSPLLTPRDRLNLHRCLQRRRFAALRSDKRPNVALYAVDPLFLLPTPPSQCTLVGNTGTYLCCGLKRLYAIA